MMDKSVCDRRKVSVVTAPGATAPGF